MKNIFPEISVIIPAFNAHKTIVRSLNSIKAQNFPLEKVEVIISVDDKKSYSEISEILPNIKILYSKYKKQTGPGETRNRAISLARGRVISFLDADDTWSKNYLKPLKYYAMRYGLAFGQTEVLDEEGNNLLNLKNNKFLTIKDFGKTPGSFHPVVLKKYAGPFLSLRSQDVGHSIKLLKNFNGRAKLLLKSKYQIWLNKKSLTNKKDFSRKIDLDYKEWIAIFRKQKLETKLKNHIVNSFELRRDWNRRYKNYIQDSKLISFYEYISSRIK